MSPGTVTPGAVSPGAVSSGAVNPGARLVGLVVAGGRGLRMEASGVHVPKPLVDVGGMALAERAVRRLLDLGLDEVHVALHHRSHEVATYLRGVPELGDDRLRWIREVEPLGTIGCLGRLRGTRRAVLAVNGDLFSDFDLGALLAEHRASGADLTVATHDEERRLQQGEIIHDGHGRVLGLSEKPTKRYRVASGAYVFEPAVVALVGERETLGAPDLVQRALRRGHDVREFHHSARWFDVNDARVLERARRSARAQPLAGGALQQASSPASRDTSGWKPRLLSRVTSGTRRSTEPGGAARRSSSG